MRDEHTPNPNFPLQAIDPEEVATPILATGA
jgi:hypothetical protein